MCLAVSFEPVSVITGLPFPNLTCSSCIRTKIYNKLLLLVVFQGLVFSIFDISQQWPDGFFHLREDPPLFFILYPVLNFVVISTMAG